MQNCEVRLVACPLVIEMVVGCGGGEVGRGEVVRGSGGVWRGSEG